MPRLIYRRHVITVDVSESGGVHAAWRGDCERGDTEFDEARHNYKGSILGRLGRGHPDRASVDSNMY